MKFVGHCILMCSVCFVGTQYWELLAHLLHSLEGEEEHEIAEQQLEDELQWLISAPAAVDDDDRVLDNVI